MLIESLPHEIGRVAADQRHRAAALETVVLGALHLQRDHGAADVVEREAPVEQADERPDRAARIVVLGFAEEQSAASFDIAEVHVVAERGAEDAAARIARQHDLRFRIVPLRLAAHADPIAPANRRQHRGLREHFCVGPDCDFEILRPKAIGDQRVLQSCCLAEPGRTARMSAPTF